MGKLEIKVVAKKLIKPSNPTPKHLRKLKLSVFDQLAARIYVNILYYYSGISRNAENDDQKCDQLEKSLSRALVQLYPFAGRFVKDDISIDCSDQGVEFRQAQVTGCKLAEFLQEGPDIELLDRFLPWEVPPVVDSLTSPQLAIQVNTFEDGGIVIGLRISHILADAATTSLVMNTWAASCKNGIGVNPFPFIDFHQKVADAFPALRSSSGINHPVISAPRNFNDADKIVTRRFLVSSRILTNIREATAKAERRPPPQPSRVVVALALIWKALMAAAVAEHGRLRDSVLVVAMNLRGKVSLGIKTDKVVGNFFMSVVVPFVANKASEDVDLYDLIILLRGAVRSRSAKLAKASRDDVLTIFLNTRRELTAIWGSKDGFDVYFCSSWYGALPVYDTDFGWGKPTWASISTQPGPGVCLKDSCDDDGTEVWVSLRQRQMIPFQQQFYSLLSRSNL